MPGGLKVGRRIQGTGGNGNARFAPGIPKQTGPALAAKPAMHIGGFVGESQTFVENTPAQRPGSRHAGGLVFKAGLSPLESLSLPR